MSVAVLPNHLTGVERTFAEDEILVSKTDTAGKITYANRVFLRVAGFLESEILGQPHNIIRHPEMPRSVFQLLWERIEAGHEIFAYVINRAKNGDHYWVHAHVTPTFDPQGSIIGYHSMRRKPDRKAVVAASDLYSILLAEEAKHENVKQAMAAGRALVEQTLQQAGMSYDEFVFSLSNEGVLA